MMNKKAVAECLRSIGARNTSINAFTYVRPSSELVDAANQADNRAARGGGRGALDGVVVAVKDNLCVKGLPLTCASNALRDTLAPYNATVVERLIAAGCIVAGKTNMDEFGMGSTSTHSRFGPVKNPLNIERVAGGSSGGSAAAVAAGMAEIALGSDTGGSVRLPAAYCGLFGFKPSYGAFSRWGLVSYASSLDTVGVFARSADRIADVIDAISGKDPKDSTSCDILKHDADIDFTKLRIGVPQEYFVDGLSLQSKMAWEECIQTFKSKGAKVIPVSLPYTSVALPTYYVIALAEASSNLARFSGTFFGDSAAKKLDSVMNYRTRGLGMRSRSALS
ncbi:amidase [Chytridium lagenaria]|nr:amidase [Chytridium lagenaria]